MTLTEASAIWSEWWATQNARPCRHFWPGGGFDVMAGQQLCINCRVPEHVHQAALLLEAGTVEAHA